MIQFDAMASLGDWQLTAFLGVVMGAAVIVAAFAIVAIRNAKARRTELAGLRRDIGKLSEDIKYLMDAERRRFLQGLKSSKNKDDQSKDESAGQQPNESDSVVALIPQRDGE